MKKKNEWEKRKIKTASIRITPFSFSMEDELIFLSRECGINDSIDFVEFLSNNAGLTREELEKYIKKYILKLAKIDDRNLSKLYRKYRAKKIEKLHTKKEIKERMDNYVQKEEYL